MGDEGISCLSQCKELKAVRVPTTRATDKSIVHLENSLVHLELLDISALELTKAVFENLPETLVELHVEKLYTEGFELIGTRCKQLQVLQATDSTLNDQSLLNILANDNLR